MRILFVILGCTLALSVRAQQQDFNLNSWSRADSIAREYQGASLKNIPLLTHYLTSNLTTDAEKFRAIYYWVTHNVEGDYTLVDKNDRSRKKYSENPEALAQWNNQFKMEVFTLLLEQKRTLCSGYAYLIQALASKAKIESVVIHGYGREGKKIFNKSTTANHSWNAVKLNGKWYLCDATWASGYTDMDTLIFEFDYDDSYFLTDPKIFAKTHQPLTEKWTLIEQKDTTTTVAINP